MDVEGNNIPFRGFCCIFSLLYSHDIIKSLSHKVFKREWNRSSERVQAYMPYDIIAHGRSLLDQGAYAAAAHVLEQAVLQYPKDSNAWVLLSNARSGLSNFVRANEAADGALQIAPHQTDALCAKARALNGLKQHSQALAMVDQIIVNAPQFALAYVIRSFILSDMEQAGQAIQAVDHALALQPTLLLALVQKNNILAQLGRKQEAFDIAQQAAKAHPASLLAQIILAISYAESGDTTGAIAQTSSSVKQYPGEH